MLVEMTIAAAIAYAAWKAKNKKKELSPKHEMALKAALNDKLTPTQFRTLADAFEKEGYKAESQLLRNRADMGEASPDKKEAWGQAFRAAMASESAEGVLKMADAFDAQGGVGAARSLREYAKGLQTAQAAGSGAPIPGSANTAPPPPANIPIPPEGPPVNTAGPPPGPPPGSAAAGAHAIAAAQASTASASPPPAPPIAHSPARTSD